MVEISFDYCPNCEEIMPHEDGVCTMCLGNAEYNPWIDNRIEG